MPSLAPLRFVPTSLLNRVDHIVYATTDLEHTIEVIAEQLGVTPSVGGAHPGRGTRNALLALGPLSYLEIVGPDRDQPDHATPRWFRIDTLTAPRLVTWAANSADLVAFRVRALKAGVMLGDVASGSRQRPDGSMLAWTLTDPTPLRDDGIVPFFIDWGTSAHPATASAKGLTLIGLRAEHPDALRVRTRLDSLGLPLDVRDAASPALIATIDGPRGEFVLR